MDGAFSFLKKQNKTKSSGIPKQILVNSGNPDILRVYEKWQHNLEFRDLCSKSLEF